MDNSLLARARTMDLDALAQVHELYQPSLYRYVLHKVGDRALAEDLCSEVFARLLKALNQNSKPQRTLQGWLFGVASRVVSDYYRQRYRLSEVEFSEELLSEAFDDPADSVAAQMTEENLYLAISELTKEQREVLALRFGHGMPTREVARTMDKSEGAVKQLQARAVASLTRMLCRRQVIDGPCCQRAEANNLAAVRRGGRLRTLGGQARSS